MKPKIKVTRIIGVDPGTGIVGFGVIDFDGGNGYKLVDAGVIRTPVNQVLEERLVTIYEELSNIIKLNRPNVMSIEKLFFAQNVTTAISVSHARGVIMLVPESRMQAGDCRIYSTTNKTGSDRLWEGR
jgi:crossover junction endodeoxyribonuclease RuvC